MCEDHSANIHRIYSIWLFEGRRECAYSLGIDIGLRCRTCTVVGDKLSVIDTDAFFMETDDRKCLGSDCPSCNKSAGEDCGLFTNIESVYSYGCRVPGITGCRTYPCASTGAIRKKMRGIAAHLF